ncbi:MAG: hypothetical protein ACREPB_10730 [Arenimonas sp.]
MDIEYSKKLLTIYIENAVRILQAGFGVNHAQSTFFSIVKLLKENPELKNYFLEKVSKVMNLNDPGTMDFELPPEELVELVTHEFRWEEMSDLAQQRVDKMYKGDWSFAVGEISQRILDAQKDDWPDREFYSYYENPRN